MSEPSAALPVQEWTEAAFLALTDKGPRADLTPELQRYARDRLLLALDCGVECCRDGAGTDLSRTLGELAPEAVMLLLTTAMQQLAFHTDWRVTVYYGKPPEGSA